MKKFDYRYSILQTGALTNSDGTNIKRRSNGGIEIFDNSWDQYLEDAIVPEITYTATNATSVDKTVKAWTFYCDSLSGCDSSSSHYMQGNGSKENPWRSLDYAIRQIRQKLTCWRNNTCCYDPFRKNKYFQLKLKGTIDYAVYYYDDNFRGAELVNNQWVQQFIISPWGNDNIVFQQNSGWSHIYGTIFNNMKILTLDHDGYYLAYIFGCGDCLFNHTTIQVNNDYARTVAFDSCHGTIFIDTKISSPVYFVPDLFVNCIGSDIIGLEMTNVPFSSGYNRGSIYNAHIVVNDESDKTEKIIDGFRYQSGISFYNCSANVSGTLNCSQSSGKYYGYVDAVGFYGNQDCTYYNCSMTNSCQKCADDGHTCRTPEF